MKTFWNLEPKEVGRTFLARGERIFVFMASWLIARFYDRLLRSVERAGLQNWREELLSGLEGRVLEIGAGTGMNLSHYPAEVTSLVLSEPDRHMRGRLQARLRQQRERQLCELSEASAERLPFPDGSFQAVVGTLVLCSVQSPYQSLREIRRVLSPGGRYVFIEHVAAEEDPTRFAWQKRLEPFWKAFGGNCHLTRSTEKAILQAGFHMDRIIREEGPGAMALARPVIRGVAVKVAYDRDYDEASGNSPVAR